MDTLPSLCWVLQPRIVLGPLELALRWAEPGKSSDSRRAVPEPSKQEQTRVTVCAFQGPTEHLSLSNEIRIWGEDLVVPFP